MSQNCPNCGEKLLSTDVFCPYCGADAKSADQTLTSPSSSTTGSITCESCGSLNPQNTQYCGNCGAGLSSTPYIGSSPSSSSFASSSSSSSQSTYNYGANSSTQDSGNRPWYKPPPSKHSGRNPATWFHYFCWGFYILLRVLFWVLIIFGKGAMRRR
ncbi:MAG: zinc ribbon domain-containing protein [Candidatus Heimdallarchaeota archaeon]|nr:zinc ribbon domain-containing protein [Candidatus Heimdallarchaeota archaeon]